MPFDEPLSTYLDPKDFGSAVVFHLVPAAARLTVGPEEDGGASFRLTAVAEGFDGNDISFRIVHPETGDVSLSVEVDGTDIVATLATNSDGDPITDLAELVAEIEASEEASALVGVSDVESTSAIPAATDAENLTGGRGGDVECNAILDHPGVEASRGPRGRMDTDLPELWCRTADVANVRRDDTVTVHDPIADADVVYQVERKEADGTGISVVHLSPNEE